MWTLVIGPRASYLRSEFGVACAAARAGVDPVRPITLIPVAALGDPDLLVEVDATAVLDEAFRRDARVRVDAWGIAVP